MRENRRIYYAKLNFLNFFIFVQNGEFSMPNSQKMKNPFSFLYIYAIIGLE